MDIAKAIAHYDALLDDAALAEESASLMVSRQPELRLTFGPRLMCGSLRPQFMSAAHYAHVQQVCEVLARAGRRLEDVILGEPRLLDVLDLSEDERRLVAIDHGFEHAATATRLDSFVTTDSWQFVEYNAESPAGMGYIDLLSDMFRELPVMQAFEREYTLRPLGIRPSMHDALLGAYHEWGGQGKPQIAIVDWMGLPTHAEFEIFQEFFAQYGLDALIVDPRALEYHSDRLYAGSTAIDVVYRRVLTHELLARKDEAPALLQAYEAGSVCVVNAFRCKLLHKKAIFAILSDDANSHLFSANELAVIRRHIPWTRLVSDGHTTYGGEQVDLVEFVLRNRDRLVLKPNDEYGGKGVSLGWETDASAWEAALRQGLDSSFVVQERVPTAQTRYPIYENGVLRHMDLIVDLDPYVFGNAVNGQLTRISPSSLLNVTAGNASTIPTFIIED
jgi:uncharacterized circularly permuted ATP-grasp superfamily protein